MVVRLLSSRNERSGGEGGILLPPLPATAEETYTCVIIACVGGGYKRIATSVPVSIVSLIGRVSRRNGITGISSTSARQEASDEGMVRGNDGM